MKPLFEPLMPGQHQLMQLTICHGGFDAQVGDDFIDRDGRSRDVERNRCTGFPERHVRASRRSIAGPCHRPLACVAVPTAAPHSGVQGFNAPTCREIVAPAGACVAWAHGTPVGSHACIICN
jgi:hypothetical protein